MKFLVVLAVAVACACADVSHIVGSDAAAQVLKQDVDIQPNNEFSFIYETSNGISQEAKGAFKNVPNVEYPVLGVVGGYRYTGPDGQVYTTNYVADENGFQPTGDHLPVAPEIPEQIQRALAYIAAHPQAEDKKENYQRVAPTPVQTPFKPAPVSKPTAYKPNPAVYNPFGRLV